MSQRLLYDDKEEFFTDLNVLGSDVDPKEIEHFQQQMESEVHEHEPPDDLIVKPISNKKQLSSLQKDVAKMKNNEAARKYRQKKKDQQDNIMQRLARTEKKYHSSIK